MTVWVFHWDNVTEYPVAPTVEDCYYKSIMFDPELPLMHWWENDGYYWQEIKEEEVPSNHRLMALLLT